MRAFAAASAVHRMLKYHSSCVANGPTPRVTGMLRELVERRLPHRIDREVRLVVPADPSVHRFARNTGGHLDPVVREAEADAFGGQRVDDLRPLALDRRVAPARRPRRSARRRHCRAPRCRRRARRPPSSTASRRRSLHGDAGHAGERLLQQQAARRGTRACRADGSACRRSARSACRRRGP